MRRFMRTSACRVLAEGVTVRPPKAATSLDPAAGRAKAPGAGMTQTARHASPQDIATLTLNERGLLRIALSKPSANLSPYWRNAVARSIWPQGCGSCSVSLDERRTQYVSSRPCPGCPRGGRQARRRRALPRGRRAAHAGEQAGARHGDRDAPRRTSQRRLRRARPLADRVPVAGQRNAASRR